MSERDVLNGVTECRFEPLHMGHVYMVKMSLGMLAAEASRQGKGHELHVIVTSHDGEVIPGADRFRWAQETFEGNPNITVHHAHNSLEHIEGYGDDYEGHGYTKDWAFWGKVATEQCGLGDTVDFVYGSESYVPGIAAACGAEPVMIDQDRDAREISGTMMRHSPYNNWEYFPDAVKPFFAKKVCITGSPYTGKATLTKALSNHYDTVMIGDASDTVYNPDERGCTEQDLERIVELHVIRAGALLEQSNRVLLSDSDPLLTRLWYETLYGEAPEELVRLSDEKRFDLHVLLDSKNVPFRPSNSFPEEESWHEFTDTIRNALEEREWPYTEIADPSKPKRITTASVAIDSGLVWSNGTELPIGWRYEDA